MSVHDGHRARRKALFREQGLTPFADHEVLELLLFYALPRRDVNPLAHELIRRFGTLDGVLTASPESLAEVEGMGENAATLLSLILPLARRARLSGQERPVILSDGAQRGGFFRDLLHGEREERLYEACLDAKGKLLCCQLVGRGALDAVSLNLRLIVEHAFRSGAVSVVLAHNHPSGLALPSRDDLAATAAAEDALRRIGVRLEDHVIVADGDYVSLRDNGVIPTGG